jgi:hypothetical protein
MKGGGVFFNFFVRERCVFNNIIEEEEETRLSVGTPSAGETEQRACEEWGDMYERESKCPLASCLWHVLRKFDDQRPWYLNMVVTLRGNAFAVLERALQSCVRGSQHPNRNAQCCFSRSVLHLSLISASALRGDAESVRGRCPSDEPPLWTVPNKALSLSLSLSLSLCG